MSATWKKALAKNLEYLEKKKIDATFISKRIIDMIKRCKNIWKSDNQTLAQLILQIYDKYKSIFDHVDIINALNINDYLPFLNDNVDLMIELFKDLLFIIEQQNYI